MRRWTLEMRDARGLRPAEIPDPEAVLVAVEESLPAYNRFLHELVGTDYAWGGREDWDEDAWSEFVNRPELETHVLHVRGAPAGYFELEFGLETGTRLHTFGLARPFLGRGLGGGLLTLAIRRAFERAPDSPLWLRTCSLDHPHALSNYRSRGFEIVREEELPPRRRRPASPPASTRGNGVDT